MNPSDLVLVLLFKKDQSSGIALLVVSRTYSQFKSFPAHIRTTSRFSQNLELPAQSIEKLGEFRQLGRV